MWWVWIITDRIPIGVGIVFVSFGFRITNWWVGAIFFGSLVLPLVLTIPRRFGLGIALSYLSRKFWPESNDPMPPLGPSTLDPRPSTIDHRPVSAASSC